MAKARQEYVWNSVHNKWVKVRAIPVRLTCASKYRFFANRSITRPKEYVITEASTGYTVGSFYDCYTIRDARARATETIQRYGLDKLHEVVEKALSKLPAKPEVKNRR